MKRLPDSTGVYESLDGARIFRDDIDDILSFLEQGGLRIEITSRNYAFDSIEDVETHLGSRPAALTIRGFSKERTFRAVEIEIEGRRLTLSGDTEELGTSAYTLRDHIRSLRFSPLWLRFWLWWMIGVAFFVADLLAPKNLSSWRSILGWLPIVFYGFAVVTWMARRALGGLRLTRRHEGGFLKRNANSIGLLLIGGIVGALATRIVVVLTSK